MRNVEVVVKTKAKKSEIIEDNGGRLKVAVKAVPEGGKANLELLKLLRKKYGCRVEILKGGRSKRKVIGLFS